MTEALLLAVLGSNWSASATEAVFVCGTGVDGDSHQLSIAGAPPAIAADIPQPGRRGVGPLARGGRHERQPGRQQVGDLTPVAVSGPLLVSVTVNVTWSPTFGVGVADGLGQAPGRPAGASRSTLARVVGGVGVELVGAG